MSHSRAQTRADLLALHPAIYLADGYLGPGGVARPELLSNFALAAATQLLAAAASPQEVAMTVEAVRLILPLHSGPPDAQLRHALEECFLVVARGIQQPNNRGIVDWLTECARFVVTAPDQAAFLAHIQAVMRLYGVLVATQPPADSAPPT